QKRLIDRAQHSNTSWLLDWWNSLAYLSYRDPLPINVNYYFQFEDNDVCKDQASRAASIVLSCLSFRNELFQGKIEKEYLAQKPLDMSQYKYLFNCCRIPQIPSDFTKVY